MHVDSLIGWLMLTRVAVCLQEHILSHLRAQDMTELNLVDYLVLCCTAEHASTASHTPTPQAYLPMFTDIHNAILSNPLF